MTDMTMLQVFMVGPNPKRLVYMHCVGSLMNKYKSEQNTGSSKSKVNKYKSLLVFFVSTRAHSSISIWS